MDGQKGGDMDLDEHWKSGPLFTLWSPRSPFVFLHSHPFRTKTTQVSSCRYIEVSGWHAVLFSIHGPLWHLMAWQPLNSGMVICPIQTRNIIVDQGQVTTTDTYKEEKLWATHPPVIHGRSEILPDGPYEGVLLGKQEVPWAGLLGSRIRVPQTSLSFYLHGIKPPCLSVSMPFCSVHGYFSLDCFFSMVTSLESGQASELSFCWCTIGTEVVLTLKES